MEADLPNAAEPPFGADDPDPFMLPLEAAQIVVEASRREIDLEAATRELVRSLVERRLTIQGQRFGRSRSEEVPANEWAHLELELLHATASSCGDSMPRREAWTELRFRRKEVLALWPPDALTLDEACVFLASRLEGDPSSNRHWLLTQFTDGRIERLYPSPITHWQHRPLALDPSDNRSSWEPLPHPKHWRVRREQLLKAILDRADEAAWRTRVPAISEPPWTAYHLACGMVARRAYDPDAARRGWSLDCWPQIGTIIH